MCSRDGRRWTGGRERWAPGLSDGEYRTVSARANAKYLVSPMQLVIRNLRFRMEFFWSGSMAPNSGFTKERLNEFIVQKRRPEPPRWGKSPFDRLNRKTLLWLFEKDACGTLTNRDIFEIVVLPARDDPAMGKRGIDFLPPGRSAPNR